MFAISALVPEMIWRRLFSSLVAFPTDSFETAFETTRGRLLSEFTVGFWSTRDARFSTNYRGGLCQIGA